MIKMPIKKKRKKLKPEDQTVLFDSEVLPEMEQSQETETDRDQSAEQEDSTGFLFDIAGLEEKTQGKPSEAESVIEEAENKATSIVEEVQAEVLNEEEALVNELEQVEVVPEDAQPNPTDIVEDALSHSDDDGEELTLAYFASKAYLEYAISVVKGRALPEVTDGLKPVQRRILYSMRRLNLSSDSKPVKSARVVGDVLGKYHPHGDQAAYDAMVRMAQDFTMRYPLVQGHGNFGSADGDPPAAMRYTEVRLHRNAELLLGELDQGTVPFVSNYDGAFKEPPILPARLPILLLNGSSGIAVGMATEIPPHNLREVASASAEMILNPETSLEKIMELLPGPDFPGGGQIISSNSEILSAYRTGYGNLKLRAVYHFEELSRGQWQLIIDQLPYKVSAQKVMEEIETLTNPRPSGERKKLTEKQQQLKQLLLGMMGSIRDESSAEESIRIVIEPKSKTVDRSNLVSTLCNLTSLEASAKFNLVTIGLDGKPAQKGIREVLSEWCEFRIQTVKRRTEATLKDVNARIHILEGRLIIILDIEEVIRIIRNAEDPKKALMETFSLSDTQAEDILEIKLRQLANLDEVKLNKELDKLRKEQSRLNDLLVNEVKMRRLISREIIADSEKFGDERRTLIEESKGSVLVQQVVDEPVTVIVSEKGFVKTRSGHDVNAAAMNFKLGDSLRAAFECRTVDYLVMLTNFGRVYSVPVSQLPGARGDGTHYSAFIQLQDKELPVDFLATAGENKILMSSDEAMGFMCKFSDLVVKQRIGKSFFTLGPKKAPLPMRLVTPLTGWIAALSSSGRLLVFDVSEMRALSSGGKGVTIIDLETGEKLVATLPITPNGVVVQGVGRGQKKQELNIGPRLIEEYRGKRARRGRRVEAKWKFTGLAPSPLDEKAREAEDVVVDETPKIPSDDLLN